MIGHWKIPGGWVCSSGLVQETLFLLCVIPPEFLDYFYKGPVILVLHSNLYCRPYNGVLALLPSQGREKMMIMTKGSPELLLLYAVITLYPLVCLFETLHLILCTKVKPRFRRKKFSFVNLVILLFLLDYVRLNA